MWERFSEIYVQCMVMHGQELSALQGFEQAQSTGEAENARAFPRVC